MVAIKNLLFSLFLGFNSFFVKTPAVVTPTPMPQVSIFPSATIVPTESPLNPDKDIVLIKTAFAEKYGRKVSDVVLTTKEYNGTHFFGSVSFKLAMEGGILLAAKNQEKKWVIVMDGNGSVPCELVAPYKFPISMVSECYSRAGKLVKLK